MGSYLFQRDLSFSFTGGGMKVEGLNMLVVSGEAGGLSKNTYVYLDRGCYWSLETKAT